MVIIVEEEKPEDFYVCKECGSTVWGKAPPEGICFKCLTDDRLSKKPQKDTSILHRISSGMVEELDRIAKDIGKKRSNLIDEALLSLVDRYNAPYNVMTCRVCHSLFRTKSFKDDVCDKCKQEKI